MLRIIYKHGSRFILNPDKQKVMFFYLSKILWLVFAPLTLVFILVVAGVVLRGFARKISNFLLGTALFLFIICGFLPVGHDALVFLESRYARPVVMPEDVDVIVVLGGYFETSISSTRGFPEMTGEGDRLLGALALAKKYPEALVLFSGGEGNLGKRRRMEGDDIRASLSAIGVPDERIVYEEESQNTYQNIRNVLDFYSPEASEHWILVTSAFHMMRAMAVARSLGWNSVIPYPVDYKTDGQYAFWPRSFDVLDNFDDITIAVREFIGILAYTVTGRIHRQNL